MPVNSGCGLYLVSLLWIFYLSIDTDKLKLNTEISPFDHSAVEVVYLTKLDALPVSAAGSPCCDLMIWRHFPCRKKRLQFENLFMEVRNVQWEIEYRIGGDVASGHFK